MNNLFDSSFLNYIGIKQAYFLGLMYSDGCVCKTTKNRHLITISSIDLDMINNIRLFFMAKNKIFVRKKPKFDKNSKQVKTQYTISFCSKKIFNKLVKLGCVRNKSHIINKPNINVNLFLPFLMGVFDGDGCLSLNRSINSWKASIGTSSYKFYVWLYSYMKKMGFHVNVEKRKTKYNNYFYSVCLIGLSAKVFLTKLYASLKNKVCPIKRKKIKFLKLCKVNFTMGPKINEWEFKYLKQKTTPLECANNINNDSRNYGWVRSENSIRSIRNYYNIKHSKVIK